MQQSGWPGEEERKIPHGGDMQPASNHPAAGVEQKLAQPAFYIIFSYVLGARKGMELVCPDTNPPQQLSRSQRATYAQWGPGVQERVVRECWVERA